MSHDYAIGYSSITQFPCYTQFTIAMIFPLLWKPFDRLALRFFDHGHE
jgi:hypothetical protein